MLDHEWLHLVETRKQNIVFNVDMLHQVVGQFGKADIKRLPGAACFGRWRKVICELFDLVQKLSVRVMFPAHLRDRVHDGWVSTAPEQWKKNGLFLCHMGFKIVQHIGQDIGKTRWCGRMSRVYRFNFARKAVEFGQLAAMRFMEAGDDVVDQGPGAFRKRIVIYTFQRGQSMFDLAEIYPALGSGIRQRNLAATAEVQFVVPEYCRCPRHCRGDFADRSMIHDVIGGRIGHCWPFLGILGRPPLLAYLKIDIRCNFDVPSIASQSDFGISDEASHHPGDETGYVTLSENRRTAMAAGAWNVFG